MRRLTPLLTLLAALDAWGAATRPAEIAAARQLAREGFRLATAGNCAEAVEPLGRAEALFHAPTTLVRLAECHLALGQLVLGTEELRRVTVEDLGASPSKAFVAARARARTLLAAAEGRLGHLTISVSGPDVEALTLQLDGEGLATAMVGVDIPVDPGSHRLHAAAPGFVPGEAAVLVAEGARERLDLALLSEGGGFPTSDAPRALLQPAPAATKVPSRPTAVAAVGPAPVGPGLRVPAIVTLVVGVVGLGVGGGFGLAALGDKARLDAACTAKACPPSAAGDLALLRRDATLSTVGWAVGGAAVATALVLFLLPAGGEGRTAWLAPARDGLVARW